MVAAAKPSASDAEARVELILRDRWVNYAQGVAAIERLGKLLRGARRTRMPSLLVFGEPDIGKTTILKKFMRGRDATIDDQTGRKKAEPKADERRLYAAILRAIGAPIPRGQVVELESATYAQLERLDTRLLIIDETNNLTIGSATAQRRTLAALRRLANQLALSFAFFGTAEALNAVMSDPQVEGRSQPLKLTRLRNDADYAAIVQAVIAYLPLQRQSLCDDAMVAAVHDLTAGSPSKTFRLLNAAAVPAIDDASEQITIELLQSAVVTRHIHTAGMMRRGAKATAG
jgi:hypothetical protein